MKQPITLERSVALQAWNITGVLAFATPREWEPALVQLALEHEGVTDALVVSELLGGRSGIARRLLDNCTRLGLLEKARDAWVPTSAGREAAATGKVFLPEQGTWTLWCAQDALLPSPILAVTAWDDGFAHLERSKEAPQRDFLALPDWIRSLEGTVATPLVGKRRYLRVGPLGEKAAPHRSSGELRLRLALSQQGIRLRARGTLAGEPLDAELPAPKLDLERAWLELLAQNGLADQWDAGRSALRVAFEATSSAERSSLIRSQLLKRPSLDGLGAFEDTTVDRLPLFPLHSTDAEVWAEWRLVEGLHTYVLQDQLEAAYRAAAAPFADLAPPCPPLADIAQRVRGKDRPRPQYWRLQAAADWSLTARRGDR